MEFTKNTDEKLHVVINKCWPYTSRYNNNKELHPNKER